MASQLLGGVSASWPSAPAPSPSGVELAGDKDDEDNELAWPMALAPLARNVVAVEGLTRSFNGRAVLRGVDLEIPAGQFVALLGHSGSGKSTLLRSLARLDELSSGTIEVPDASAVVFQEPRLIPWKRVWQNVVLGLPGLAKAKAAREAALVALAEVGLSELADVWPVTLSGGEAQRVALARALVREPVLLLLDEPLGALDALTRLKMHGLVQLLWERHNPAVLLVTHDVDEALALADRVLVLSDGKIATDVRVDLARPRRRASPEFAALRWGLLRQLGVDEAAL